MNMADFKAFVSATLGATLGAVGTATQTNETLETISLVITIIGAIISFIVCPIISWYRNAKKDGKITIDELKEAAEELKDGLDKTKHSIKGSQTADEDKREEIKKKGGTK